MYNNWINTKKLIVVTTHVSVCGLLSWYVVSVMSCVQSTWFTLSGNKVMWLTHSALRCSFLNICDPLWKTDHLNQIIDLQDGRLKLVIFFYNFHMWSSTGKPGMWEAVRNNIRAFLLPMVITLQIRDRLWQTRHVGFFAKTRYMHRQNSSCGIFRENCDRDIYQ